MNLSLLLVASSAVIFLLAILSWHQHMSLADSKNNQMLLSIAVCAAISFVASVILTQTKSYHSWMGFVLVMFTQLGVLAVTIARFHQMTLDSHTESQLGSLSAQQAVNAVILVLSVIVVASAAVNAYENDRESRIASKIVQDLLSEDERRQMYGENAVNTATIDQFVRTYSIRPSLRLRAQWLDEFGPPTDMKIYKTNPFRA